jgi:hypothetical protein
MNISRLTLTCIILLFSEILPAQDITFPELQGYKKNTLFQVYTSDNLKQYNADLAEVCSAFSFKDLNLAEYRKGKNLISVEIFRFTDSYNAFGIYSSERLPSYRFLNLGTQGYSNGGYINFVKGQFYVRLRNSRVNEKNMQISETLALRIATMLPGNPEMPGVLSKFPETGKKANEETYINRNVLGHQFLSHAFRAAYVVGPDEFAIYIIETQSSSETIETADAYLRKCGEDEQSSENGKYVITDARNGTVFLAWQNRTVVIITGLSKDQADVADQYTSEILQ